MYCTTVIRLQVNAAPVPVPTLEVCIIPDVLKFVVWYALFAYCPVRRLMVLVGSNEPYYSSTNSCSRVSTWTMPHAQPYFILTLAVQSVPLP